MPQVNDNYKDETDLLLQKAKEMLPTDKIETKPSCDTCPIMVGTLRALIHVIKER